MIRDLFAKIIDETKVQKGTVTLPIQASKQITSHYGNKHLPPGKTCGNEGRRRTFNVEKGQQAIKPQETKIIVPPKKNKKSNYVPAIIWKPLFSRGCRPEKMVSWRLEGMYVTPLGNVRNSYGSLIIEGATNK